MNDVLTPADLVPYRRIRTDHEAKFSHFLRSVGRGDLATTVDADDSAYAIQVVTQVNYGPVLSKRYFASSALVASGGPFQEITEADMVGLNLQKLNAYQNFKSKSANHFYELNVYKRDPVNKHHWRADIARPAGDIDL